MVLHVILRPCIAGTIIDTHTAVQDVLLCVSFAVPATRVVAGTEILSRP